MCVSQSETDMHCTYTYVIVFVKVLQDNLWRTPQDVFGMAAQVNVLKEQGLVPLWADGSLHQHRAIAVVLKAHHCIWICNKGTRYTYVRTYVHTMKHMSTKCGHMQSNTSTIMVCNTIFIPRMYGIRQTAWVYTGMGDYKPACPLLTNSKSPSSICEDTNSSANTIISVHACN